MLKTTSTTITETLPKTVDNSNFLTSKAKLVSLQLKQAFTKALIFHHLDLKRYIKIKTDTSGYAIGDILCQITLIFRQWHFIVFFSGKMILAKTQYKTYEQKLLAIVNPFKTWCHYVKGCKFEILIFTDHNNFCRFINPRV